jgi:hypothetical protein
MPLNREELYGEIKELQVRVATLERELATLKSTEERRIRGSSNLPLWVAVFIEGAALVYSFLR